MNLNLNSPDIDPKEDLCKYDNPKQTKICLDLLVSFLSFFYRNTNFEILYQEFILNTDCYDEIISLFKYNQAEFIDLINFNGKTLQDYGLEIECTQHGYKYFLINFKVDKLLFIKSNIIDFLDNFLNIREFNLGICSPKKCEKLLVTFFNETKNEKFFNYIEKNGLIDLKLYSNSKIENFSPEFKRFFIGVIIYLALKTLLTLMCFFFNFEAQRIRKDSSNSNYQYYIVGKK